MSEGGGERLSRSYAYNSFGDISALTEETTSNSFTYDGLGRLTSAYGRTYSYDAANRLTSFNGQVYNYYDSGPYHAVDRIGDFDRFDYDANGNMVTRNKGLSSQQTLVWDAENRLSQVQDNNGDLVEQYWYDVDGARVKKVSGTTTTYTFFAQYEEEVTDGVTTVVSYYTFGSMRVAVKRGNTLYHLHGDHLGSTSLTTAGSAVEASRTYYAYGSERAATGDLQTDRTFTGQKSDATGLMYYNARYYDPGLGTFVSPDSLVPGAGQVVNYNRFLYAKANPLKYADPSGHIPFLVILVVAGVVGGLSNAVGNAAVQVKENWDSERSWQENITDFNKKEAAIAFGYGFASGSLAPVLGPGPALAANFVLGAGQEITTDMVVHDKSFVESVDWETAESAILSAAGGYIQTRIPRKISTTSRPLPGGREPLELSINPVDKWYGDPELIEGNIRSLGGKQLQAITGTRSLLGATSGNAPLSEAMSTLGVEPYVQGATDWVEEKAEQVMRKVQDIIWGGGGDRLHDREPLHFMI